MANLNVDKQRLVDALQLVRTAMNSPNAFENSKESTFSALRRGCLDLRKSVELLDCEEFTPDLIQYAWLFLMELSKAKLRRKHALECINIMLLSPKWGAILRTNKDIQAKMPSLSKDMQTAFGFTPTGSPKVQAVVPGGPTTSNIPTAALTRKASVLPSLPAIVRAKSKLKRGNSMKPVKVTESSPATRPASPEGVDRGVDSGLDEGGTGISSLALPGLREDAPNLPNPFNPFRMDFNPFKDARGIKVRSNPHSLKNGGNWWEESHTEAVLPVWWD